MSTTLRNLIGTVRAEADRSTAGANAAARAARDVVEEELAPVRDEVNELRPDLETQADRLGALEDAVDVLILDGLLGGIESV